jgi:hypothetical protein
VPCYLHIPRSLGGGIPKKPHALQFPSRRRSERTVLVHENRLYDLPLHMYVEQSVHQITPRVSAAGVIRDGDVLIRLLRVQRTTALWHVYSKHRTSINVAAVIL